MPEESQHDMRWMQPRPSTNTAVSPVMPRDQCGLPDARRFNTSSESRAPERHLPIDFSNLE